MKVAMVGPYPLGRTVTGGIEAVAVALTDGLRLLNDIELHIVTVSPQMPRSPRAAAAAIHCLPSSGRWRRLTLYRRERAAIARCLRELRPDLVHVQGQNFYALGALDAGFPTVVTLHGMLFREAHIVDQRSQWTERLSKRLRGLFNAAFEATTLRRATDLIIISPYVAECVASRTRARLHPIDNPIDDAFFAVPAAEEPARLFFAGALEPRKGLHDLIEAVHLVRAQAQPATPQRCAHLHIAGAALDRGYAAALKRRVGMAGLTGAVRFLGVISEQELLREYAQATLIVMASREESSPMLLQQAMAAGKAVVAPRVGGVPYLVEDEVTGRVVAPENPKALADAIGRLLADPAARQRMGAEGRRRADSRFRAAAVAARTRQVYLDVLRPTPAREVAAPLATVSGERQ
jgi:glycosyltransferase involved in cell wall biosynthesis